MQLRVIHLRDGGAEPEISLPSRFDVVLFRSSHDETLPPALSIPAQLSHVVNHLLDCISDELHLLLAVWIRKHRLAEAELALDEPLGDGQRAGRVVRDALRVPAAPG